MKLYTPSCPKCGLPAKGILETVQGCALLRFSGLQTAEYAGETDLFWDEQRPVPAPAGTAVLLCYCGQDWLSVCDWGDSAQVPPPPTSQAPTSLWAAVKALRIPWVNHSSDLYLPDTPIVRGLLEKFPEDAQNKSRFFNQVEKVFWWDVSFAYLPFWEEVAKRSKKP